MVCGLTLVANSLTTLLIFTSSPFSLTLFSLSSCSLILFLSLSFSHTLFLTSFSFPFCLSLFTPFSSLSLFVLFPLSLLLSHTISFWPPTFSLFLPSSLSLISPPPLYSLSLFWPCFSHSLFGSVSPNLSPSSTVSFNIPLFPNSSHSFPFFPSLKIKFFFFLSLLKMRIFISFVFLNCLSLSLNAFFSLLISVNMEHFYLAILVVAICTIKVHNRTWTWVGNSVVKIINFVIFSMRFILHTIVTNTKPQLMVSLKF